MFAVLAPNKDTKIPLRGVELPITEPDLHYPYTYTGKQLAVVTEYRHTAPLSAGQNIVCQTA